MNKYSACKQENDYSCGVAALRYLMMQTIPGLIVGSELWPTEEKLKTTPEEGTSHESITNYLASVGVKFVEHKGQPITSLMPPFMVNYQWDRDGHYGVVVNVGDKIQIWNPWKATLDKYNVAEFDRRWHSKRYGVRWALSILPIGD
jgi:ABC-type bacteriocin/lantibiotic exporter with double-glycine peptidase domain